MTHFQLPETAHIGYAHLRVTDLERALAFYRDAVGLRELSHDGATVTLTGASGANAPAHLILTEQRGARPKPQRSVGLYHVAIRLPNRTALGQLFRRLVLLEVPFGGFSDHGVSEALYLADPDGNGLELYRDRPRADWPFEPGGTMIEMVTKPLDVQRLLYEAEEADAPWQGIADGTDIGHVHLHVSDLKRAEAFYVDLLGFDVMQRTYVGALFVSAGGYHHHVGLNIWAGRAQPPADAVGMTSFSVVIPEAKAWETLAERVRASGRLFEPLGERAFRTRDDDGNAVDLTLG